MSDYFDQFELALRSAVARRAHLRWYARWRLPIRHRGLALVIAGLVVVTPAVAAVGALSGWFSTGKPDIFYPASSTAGLGKTIPGTRILPIRAADPAGGPPWGMRLVRTNRGDTCVQVGRVEHGQIGSLGIDYSWGNDHKFHPIKPNDGADDICGATDAAGDGFGEPSMHGWPESAFNPSDYGSGKAASYCQNANPGRRSHIHACPPGSLRMIFVGLLGPDAKSITYKTPTGATKTENTVGGVGAYLIVFKQTASTCETLLGAGNDCAANYAGTDNSALRPPNAVTSVTYDNGKTCSAGGRNSFQAIVPRCPPVGWVAAKQPKLTNAQLASPIRLTTVEAKQYCYDTFGGPAYKTRDIACDNGVPKGYHRAYLTPPGKKAQPLVLVTFSFTARQPVSTTNSWYAWQITVPGGGSEGNRTQTNIHRGQRVTFWNFEQANQPGIYQGVVTFMQNAGPNGPGGSDHGHLIVGRFRFKVR